LPRYVARKSPKKAMIHYRAAQQTAQSIHPTTTPMYYHFDEPVLEIKDRIFRIIPEHSVLAEQQPFGQPTKADSCRP
jgi:hypothetical protein